MSTLLASDAPFKIIVSPTAMVGPDDTTTGKQGKFLSPLFGGVPVGQEGDRRKRDNHTNELGFRDEGEAFIRWLGETGLLAEHVFVICGERHWQYHSVHPSGLEEFSVGALIDGNARLGPSPGDPESTDPEGLIAQPYSQEEKSGGFLEVTVAPNKRGQPASAVFAFYDENGVRLYPIVHEAKG